MTTIESIGVIVVTLAVIASLIYMALQRKYTEIEQKLKDLQSPERVKLYEDAFNSANEQQKMLINLVANLSGFLYTSIPASPEATGVMKEVTKLLNEIRDNIPADTKALNVSTDIDCP